MTDRSHILANRAHLRAYMQQALDNMVYYRGDIKLSVQIGTPVLFQYVPLPHKSDIADIPDVRLNTISSRNS